jgi:CubicO group peptidase (beta-lactamase class C family)
MLAAAALAALAAAAPEPPGAGEVAKRMAASFDPIARRAVEDHGLPGLVVGVVAGGRLAWSGAWGVRNVGGTEPLTTRSLFHMASVTKPFVGTAVMQLVEQGGVELDAPVVRYLPYFALADPRAALITVRQMLSHTSGMPDVRDYEWEKAVADEGALERYVRGLGREEMIAAPGERFRYSNMAYEVLGHLVAKVSGETFEGYVKAHILAPLGMKDSTVFKPEADPALTTTPHVLDGQLAVAPSAVYPYNRMHGPSSTLHSNVPDMARFALANLRRGELDGRRILKSESYDVLWKPTGDASRPVAISWFQGENAGRRTVGHGGGDTGYRSNLLLLPDEGVAVIAMCHFDGCPVGGLTNAALDVALGLPARSVPRSLYLALGRTVLARGAAAAVGQYRELKATAAAEYDFGERVLNGLGYWLLGRDRATDAIEIFKLNVEAYPESANVYDSLGEAYRKAGQRDLSLANYRKALERDPQNEGAIRAIRELEAQP